MFVMSSQCFSAFLAINVLEIKDVLSPVSNNTIPLIAQINLFAEPSKCHCEMENGCLIAIHGTCFNTTCHSSRQLDWTQTVFSDAQKIILTWRLPYSFDVTEKGFRSINNRLII